MAEKSRLASSLEENEQLSEVLREFPCLYDKSKKVIGQKYSGKNGWKQVADKLKFLSDCKKNSC